MEIQVLGVGNAFTARYYNTSFLINSTRLYLVDCPQGLFRLLRERDIDPAAIHHVIITHIHGDHTAGLETLLLWKKYAQRTKTTICTSAAVFRELKERFFPSFSATFSPDLREIVTTRFEDYVEFWELKADRQNRLDDGLSVEYRHNWHPTPTLGLKFLSPEGSVGISGDTCYRPPLLEALRQEGRIDESRYYRLAGDWLWASNLIYHEADRGQAGPHTAETDLLALPAEVRRKIRLVHLADDFEADELPTAREGEVVTFQGPGRVVVTPPPGG